MRRLAEKRFIFSFTVFVLSVTFMLGLWMVDIGSSTMSLNSKGYGQAMIQIIGLFGIRSPNVHYHIGLVMSAASFIILATSFLIVVFRGDLR